jgi:hypothetical protein
MIFKKSFHVLFLLTVLLTAACTPPMAPEPQITIGHVTPTPEVFNPLDPSPTPSDSTLPLTCQVTDLKVYVNEAWNYCFAYPMQFTLDDSRAVEGFVTVYGPALEDNPNPVRASLEVAAQPVPEGSELAPLAGAYLDALGEVPWTIAREPWRLGSETAEKLEPVPGLLSSRVVIALHQNILVTLRFHPSDVALAKPDLEALTQTVSGSFAFLPGIAEPAPRVQTLNWYEFGQNISLSYESILAPWVEARLVPAVPVNDQIMFAEAHPTFAQIPFFGFQGGRLYDLPLMMEDRVAQVMVFPTAEFPGFGDDHPQGFVNQNQVLIDVLENGVESGRCAQPITEERDLPFLPWVNSRQAFCAQPQIIDFAGGRGLRYLTYYSQGPNPVLESQVFYTFQGLTDDGQFYVAAFFPVQTGIFPVEPPACPQCGESDYDPFAEMQTVLTEQLVELNAQAEDDFAPSLKVLDDLIKSIHIGK